MDGERSSWAPVLVGIAPARPGEEGQPLSAIAPKSTGRRIADMLDLSPLEYMREFDRVNVCPTWKEGTIAPRSYHRHAENLAGSILRGRRVVLLGANVAECFGVFKPPLLEWVKEAGIAHGLAGFRVGRLPLPFSWAVLPHPSGRNRWYNDPDNARLARQFLRDILA